MGSLNPKRQIMYFQQLTRMTKTSSFRVTIRLWIIRLRDTFIQDLYEGSLYKLYYVADKKGIFDLDKVTWEDDETSIKQWNRTIFHGPAVPGGKFKAIHKLGQRIKVCFRSYSWKHSLQLDYRAHKLQMKLYYVFFYV